MKFLPLFLALALITAPRSGFADHGVFGFGIELTGSGSTATNNGQTTLYALDNSGGSRLTPLNSTATLNTSWTGSSSGSSPSFNLGTFVSGSGDTLSVNGGSYLTYQNGNSGKADYVGSATLEYRVYQLGGSAPSFTGISLTTTYFNVNNNTGDNRWSSESSPGTNILSGLAPGTYELEVYGFDNSSSNSADSFTDYETNGGSNFGALFTVAVPEPGTLLGGFAFVGVVVIYARRSLAGILHRLAPSFV